MSARRVDWSAPPSQRSAARRPSWLAPAPIAPPKSEGRPSLTLIPSGRPPPRISIPPEPPPSVSEPPPYQRVPDDRDEQIRALTGELETAKETAATLAAELVTLRRRTLEASESELVKLALVIAERVVGDALQTDATLMVKWAKQAIAMLPAKMEIVVAIAPDLAELISAAAWAVATEGEHRLEIDKSLPRGTCEVREGVISIEVSEAARMAAVGEAIGAIS